MKNFYCVYIQELDDPPEPYSLHTNRQEANQIKSSLTEELKEDGRKGVRVIIRKITQNEYNYLNS